jgi:molybdate transport system substrate-binding protein
MFVQLRRWCSVSLIGTVLLVACVVPSWSGEARVAVAANFTAAAQEIEGLFKQATGNDAIYSFGSTGQLYTQMSQGAPFDVFLAADQERPGKAIEEGYAVPGTRFTYATGKIVLLSMDSARPASEATLREGKFTKIAIANPRTAPYGGAAVETMKALGVYETLKSKIVEGDNITQTYQFVATENAPIGFVALSQVATNDKGTRWLVPESLYSPIAQDAVLLKHGEDNEAAKGFISFLRGKEARAVKEKYGYGPGE